MTNKLATTQEFLGSYGVSGEPLLDFKPGQQHIHSLCSERPHNRY